MATKNSVQAFNETVRPFFEHKNAYNQWIALSNYIINLLVKEQKFKQINLMNIKESNLETEVINKILEFDFAHTYQLKCYFEKAFQMYD